MTNPGLKIRQVLIFNIWNMNSVRIFEYCISFVLNKQSPEWVKIN